MRSTKLIQIELSHKALSIYFTILYRDDVFPFLVSGVVGVSHLSDGITEKLPRARAHEMS